MGGYYLRDVERAELRIRREAPQMTIEKYDYGFKLVVEAPKDASIYRVWTVMQPGREENGQVEVITPDICLTMLIKEWNRDYGRQS